MSVNDDPKDKRRAGTTPLHGRPLDDDGSVELYPTDAVFDSGARRSGITPFYSAIPFISLKRVALRATGSVRGSFWRDGDTGFDYHGGSLTYGYGNWAKGLPFEDTFNHAIEHLLKWKDALEAGGLPQDDDLAGAAWAILLPLMTFEQEYALQLSFQQDLVSSSTATAEEIDAAIAAKFKPVLIRRLAPQLAPKPKQAAQPPRAAVVHAGWDSYGIVQRWIDSPAAVDTVPADIITALRSILGNAS